MTNYLYFSFFIGGLMLGGGLAGMIQQHFKEQEKEELYKYAAKEVLDHVTKAAEVAKDTNKIACMEFEFKKDTIHIPVFSKKIKTTCK